MKRTVTLVNVLLITLVYVVGTRRQWSSLEFFLAFFVLAVIESASFGICEHWIDDRKFQSDTTDRAAAGRGSDALPLAFRLAPHFHSRTFHTLPD